MNKQSYFDSLEDIVTDSIYLTSNTDELHREVQANHWSIGIDSDTAKAVGQADLVAFLDRVRGNRAGQLGLTNVEADLLFYLWFDKQAGNLNFNLINSNHHKLPFDSEVEMVDSEVPILEEFLYSRYVDGVGWGELEDTDDSVEGAKGAHRVKVHMQVLKRITSTVQKEL